MHHHHKIYDKLFFGLNLEVINESNQVYEPLLTQAESVFLNVALVKCWDRVVVFME